jgi:phosphoglycerate dehydrogenase-like enzyme
MDSKPIVVLALSQEMAGEMFRAADLSRLSAAAEVRGPFSGETLRDGVLGKALSGASVVITGWGTPRLESHLLGESNSVRLIAHSAGSVRHLVNDRTFARGIRVSNAADVNAIPVAQFTIGAITMLLKQVPWIGLAYARGDRAEVERRKRQVRELQDIDVGIIAASRVGRLVIEMLKAYPRVRVKLYDPFVTVEQARELGVELVSLEDACRCEVVSIHAPNLPSTRHMFNAQRLALLPDHAVLINTSRGALIDEAALLAEVNRRPLYVALDVTDPEPPAPNSPLRTAPNVYLTPHIAGAMKQARLDMGQVAIEETLRFLAGEPLKHEITREMLPRQA